MTWSIQLFTARLNEKADRMQGKLTDAFDQLELLETQTEGLKAVWEGEASEEWFAQLQSCLDEGKTRIQEMRDLLSKVLEAAEKLVLVEEQNKKLVEELKG